MAHPTQHHHLRFLLLAVAWAVAWTGWGGYAAHAQQQDRVPRQAIVSTGELTEDQRDAIDAFLDHWVGVLKKSDVSQKRISNARDSLIEPVRTPGATNYFRQYYSQKLSNRLKQLTDVDRLMVRLNIAVIAGHLVSGGAIDLAVTSLKDDNPAVRYRGANAIESILDHISGNNQLDIPRKLKLLKTLGQMGRNVKSTEVLKQVMQAMVALDQPAEPLPKAIDQTLQLLGARLKWHVDQPYEPYLAEHAGLGAIYTRLLNAANPSPVQVREMASISDRYMTLIARHLIDAKRQKKQGGKSPISSDEQKEHAAMLRLCNFALRFAYNALGSDITRPKNIEQLITFENWRQIRLVATEEWRKVLTAAPFSIPPEKLNIVGENKQAGKQ